MARQDKNTETAAASFPPMAPFDPETLQRVAQPAMAAAAEINSRLIEGTLEMQKEWASFVSKRLHEDFVTQQRFAACRTFQELSEVTVDFWNRAFTQYGEELGRLAKLGETLTRDTMSTVQKHAEAAQSPARKAH